MTPLETARVIAKAGGDTAFARLLGLQGRFVQQRVNNWKRRGMPSEVILEHYEVIQQLRAEVAERPKRKPN